MIQWHIWQEISSYIFCAQQIVFRMTVLKFYSVKTE